MSADGSFERNLVRALGHPLRLRLLEAVIESGEESPVELSERLKIPLATVSRHMRMLRDLGFIEETRTEVRRGAVKHYYRAANVAFIDDAEWTRLPKAMRRGLSRQTLRLIFHEASVSGGHGGFDAPDAALVRVALRLDERGRQEIADAMHDLLRDAELIQQRSDARGAAGSAPSGETEPTRLAILHFHSTDAYPSFRRTGATHGQPRPPGEAA